MLHATDADQTVCEGCEQHPLSTARGSAVCRLSGV